VRHAPASYIAKGDIVVARWDGGGMHTGPDFSGPPVDSLPAASGKKGPSQARHGSSWRTAKSPRSWATKKAL
jgi:hypothetical protein